MKRGGFIPRPARPAQSVAKNCGTEDYIRFIIFPPGDRSNFARARARARERRGERERELFERSNMPKTFRISLSL